MLSGAASRRRIIGISDWPPDRGTAPAATAAIASSIDEAFVYSSTDGITM
jgi:hypothetical protein